MSKSRIDIGRLAIFSFRTRVQVTQRERELVKTDYIVISEFNKNLLRYSEVSIQSIEYIPGDMIAVKKSTNPTSMVPFCLN